MPVSQESTHVDTAAGEPPGAARDRGIATWVIALARFMVVLDGTIMFVALPKIQQSLDISPSNLSWVVNGYSLTFGGLMLVAGRIGDAFGRRNVFRAGLALFGVASLLGGLAPNGTALIAFRALQGIGAAIATPGALSLLVSTFPDGKARTKALSLYGTMTGMASVVGLLLGGVLTTYANWRWVLLVNVPVTVAILIGVSVLVEGEPQRVRIDLPGAVTATLGVGTLVFAINRVAEHGWSDPTVIGCLVLAGALLVAFVVIQARSRTPMVPREVVSERGRAGANVVVFLSSVGMFATFYFLTLYMQHVLGYSALRAGLMFLPLAVGFGISAGAGPQLLTRTSERIALSVGLALAAAGTLWFGFLTAHSSIFAVLIPASLVTGIGLGATTVIATTIGVRGIDSSEAGIGSALLTAGSQVGGAVGLAILATVAASTSRHAAPGTPDNEALTSGYTAGFKTAVVFYVVSILLALIIIRPPAQTPGGSS
jgi:EmrB/QacA subfamily drug resistance transporter